MLSNSWGVHPSGSDGPPTRHTPRGFTTGTTGAHHRAPPLGNARTTPHGTVEFGNGTSTLRALVEADVPISFTKQAKTAGSRCAERFAHYRLASTMKQARDLGATNADLYHDIRGGIIVPTDPGLATNLLAHVHDPSAAAVWYQMALPFHHGIFIVEDMNLDIVRDSTLRSPPSPMLFQSICSSTGREHAPAWLHLHHARPAQPPPQPPVDDEPDPEHVDFAPAGNHHAIPTGTIGAYTMAVPEAWPLLADLHRPDQAIHYGPIHSTPIAAAHVTPQSLETFETGVCG